MPITYKSNINYAVSFIQCKISSRSIYAKPHLSQDNVKQNLSVTGRNFGPTCHNDR